MNCNNCNYNCNQGRNCPQAEYLELSPSEENAIKTCGCIFIALICAGILSSIYML